jgi:hypothetical protein
MSEYKVISTFLFGGQIDPMGLKHEAINTFDEYLHDPVYETESEFSDACERILDALEKDYVFEFYGDKYNSDELRAMLLSNKEELYSEYSCFCSLADNKKMNLETWDDAKTTIFNSGVLDWDWGIDKDGKKRDSDQVLEQFASFLYNRSKEFERHDFQYALKAFILEDLGDKLGAYGIE